MAYNPHEAAIKFARETQESAAREFERRRISAGSTGMSGGQKRGGLALFAIIALVVLLPIIALIVFVFAGAKLLGG